MEQDSFPAAEKKTKKKLFDPSTLGRAPFDRLRMTVRLGFAFHDLIAIVTGAFAPSTL